MINCANIHFHYLFFHVFEEMNKKMKEKIFIISSIMFTLFNLNKIYFINNITYEIIITGYL